MSLRARRWAGLALVVVGLPVLTAAVAPSRDGLSLGSVLLLYVLAVVLVAAVGGLPIALLAAAVAFLLVNWFVVPPLHTLSIGRRDDVVALATFIAVAVAVSLALDLAARQRATAERRRLETDLLARLVSMPVSTLSVHEVLRQAVATLGLSSAALVEAIESGEREVDSAGAAGAAGASTEVWVAAGPGLRLVARGEHPGDADPKVLAGLAASAARAMEAERLAAQADRARELAEVDRLRAALLAAVSHDLRTPLAGIKASASSLRTADVDFSPAEQAELLATIEDSADRLDDLVSNLLAMSRLQAGVLTVDLQPVPVDEVVARALLGHPAADVDLRVPDDLPLVLADPVLLERVVANLVSNARAFMPPGTRVRIEARPDGQRMLLTVQDRGPGVPAADRGRIFTPFQRLDDTGGGGVGLGLAIARGFVQACGGTLEPSQTPGGGLTMTVTMPLAKTAPTPPIPPSQTDPTPDPGAP